MQLNDYQTQQTPNDLKSRELEKIIGSDLKRLSSELNGVTMHQSPTSAHILVIVRDQSTQFEKVESAIRKQIEAHNAANQQKVQALVMRQTRLWERLRARQNQLVSLIALGEVLFDDGLLSELRLLIKHANTIQAQFPTYFLSYALVGSRVRTTCTPVSDIDLLLVFDDTDASEADADQRRERMLEAAKESMIKLCQETSVSRKISVAVYRLTHLCEAVHDSRPIIVTMIADGVPIIDRSMFSAWQRLIGRGNIPPSRHACQSLMQASTERLAAAHEKLRSCITDDAYYAAVNAVQALLMAWGERPPIPSELSQEARSILASKLNLLNKEELGLIDELYELHKQAERGNESYQLCKDTMDLIRRGDQLVAECDRKLNQALCLGAIRQAATTFCQFPWSPDQSEYWLAEVHKSKPQIPIQELEEAILRFTTTLDSETLERENCEQIYAEIARFSKII